VTGASSGGVLYKPDGRVGSAACYGAGCWAARGVGATASGTGEQLIQAQLPRRVSEELIRARRKRKAGSSSHPGGEDPSPADDTLSTEGIVEGIMQDFVMNRDEDETSDVDTGPGEDAFSDEPAIGGVLAIAQKVCNARSFDSAYSMTSTASDDRVDPGVEFEIVWSHNSRSFAVAYLSGQMDMLRVPARCSFSRIRDTASSPQLRTRYASREVLTTCASIT
jgi:hypothetical protein